MTDHLSRRSFLHYGATAVTGSVLVRSVVAHHPGPLPAHADFDLEETTIAQLQEAMRTGARTSHSICAAYLARIAELDPKLHAVLETNPDALTVADRLDAERKTGHVRGPLHGIPVLVKDNIATADRMMTTAGSLALVSRSGVIPIAHTQDTAGPMCRTVTDAAILLGALAGADPGDPATAAAPSTVPDYTKALDPNGLKGARIGVVRTAFGSPEGDRLVNAALDVLKAQGAVLVDPVEIPHMRDYGDQEFAVLLYELKADLNAYLEGLGAASRVKTLADVIAFNDAHKDTEMPYFGQETFLQAQEKGPLTDDAYVEALAHCRRLSRAEGADVAFAKDKLDALVAPTGGPAWLIDLVNGDCSGAGGNSSIAAVAGYPTITVPVGYSFGLPVGMSFIGKPWTEATLIKLAYACEQAAKPRRAPRFLPTADLSHR